MQSNLNNLQFQQMQILQQQQRLANMMQQKQRGYQQHPQQQWEENPQFNKQQLLQQQQHQQQQQQQQQQQLHHQQQQARMNQKDMHMMRPHAIPQPNVIPPKQPVQQQQQQQQPIIPSVSSPMNPPLPENAISVKTVAQQKNLVQYQSRDNIYQDTLNLQHRRHIDLAQSKKKSIESASMERRTRMQHGSAAAFGPGYRGYGNGKTGIASRIRFPRDNKKRSRTAKRDKFRL